jgi:hypothetical protein
MRSVSSGRPTRSVRPIETIGAGFLRHVQIPPGNNATFMLGHLRRPRLGVGDGNPCALLFGSTILNLAVRIAAPSSAVWLSSSPSPTSATCRLSTVYRLVGFTAGEGVGNSGAHASYPNWPVPGVQTRATEAPTIEVQRPQRLTERVAKLDIVVDDQDCRISLRHRCQSRLD